MPSCTTASLNLACFRGYNLTRLQKIAFIIWYQANELSVNGGTNYTNVLTQGPTSLRNAAKQQFDHWDRDAMDTALVSIAYNRAIAAGANVSNVPNTVIHQIPTLLNNIGEDDLIKMKTFLSCALGAHRNPPV